MDVWRGGLAILRHLVTNARRSDQTYGRRVSRATCCTHLANVGGSTVRGRWVTLRNHVLYPWAGPCELVLTSYKYTQSSTLSMAQHPSQPMCWVDVPTWGLTHPLGMAPCPSQRVRCEGDGSCSGSRTGCWVYTATLFNPIHLAWHRIEVTEYGAREARGPR